MKFFMTSLNGQSPRFFSGYLMSWLWFLSYNFVIDTTFVSVRGGSAEYQALIYIYKLKIAKGGMARLRSIDICPWNLEPSRSRSQTKVPMEKTHEVYLYPKCERVIDHGRGTIKLNANYFFIYLFIYFLNFFFIKNK